MIPQLIDDRGFGYSAKNKTVRQKVNPYFLPVGISKKSQGDPDDFLREGRRGFCDFGTSCLRAE
jgi:hypothetical protein